jgi:hypothetical protein
LLSGDADASLGGRDVSRQAILYLSHDVNNAVWRTYERLKKECSIFADTYFILNLSSDSIPPDAEGTVPITPTQRAELGHPSRAGAVGWWMDTSLSHKLVVQSGIDQAILTFRKIKPGYDYYWLVEFDVEFSGCWTTVFNAFSDNTSDLLCTNMHRYETNPTWGWWKCLVWPNEPKPEVIRGFLPFARLSAKAMDTIIAAGQSGIDGFYEIMWPTVLRRHGLVIEDIGGDGPFVRSNNVNRWYTSTLTNDTLSPGTFVARPIRFRPGRMANKLWHPIKRRFIRHVVSRLILRISPNRAQ